MDEKRYQSNVFLGPNSEGDRKCFRSLGIVGQRGLKIHKLGRSTPPIKIWRANFYDRGIKNTNSGAEFYTTGGLCYALRL